VEDTEGGGSRREGRDPRWRQVIRGGARGGVRFYWPDGRPFPDAPPAPKLPHDPVRALKAEHGRSGDPRGPGDDHTPLERRAVRRGVGHSHAQEALTGQTREKDP